MKAQCRPIDQIELSNCPHAIIFLQHLLNHDISDLLPTGAPSFPNWKIPSPPSIFNVSNDFKLLILQQVDDSFQVSALKIRS